MKNMSILVLFFMIFFNWNFDSIVGIYEWGNDSLIFEVDGIFKGTDYNLNYGESFGGVWNRVNDSIVYVKLDTTLEVFGQRWYGSYYIDNFYCIQRTGCQMYDFQKIRCYFDEQDGSPYFNKTYYPHVIFHNNGSIKSDRKDEWLNGMVTNYYPNGKINEIIEYEKDERHGIYLKYDSDGNLLIHQYWTEGKLDSLNSKENHVQSDEIGINYYSNGGVKEIFGCNKGKKHGIYLYYDLENSRLLTHQHWRKGKQHGSYIEYDSDGRMLMHQYWKKGRLERDLMPIYKFDE